MNDIIYGSLLGDASIYRDRTSFRFVMGHSDKQYDYLLWKAYLIGCNSKPQAYITGYGSPAHQIRYYNKPLLEKIHSICVTNEKKKISEEWLDNCTDRSLAIWYQDDGSWGKVGPRIGPYKKRGERRATFFTCDFDDESQELLCNWLIDLGYNASIFIHKKKYKSIKLSHSSTLKLWNVVAPYLFLKHKVDMSIKPCIINCLCGSYISTKLKFLYCNCCAYEFGITGQLSRNTMYSRFGTTSINRLQRMVKPVIEEPIIHWFDHSRLIDAQFPFAKEG